MHDFFAGLLAWHAAGGPFFGRCLNAGGMPALAPYASAQQALVRGRDRRGPGGLSGAGREASDICGPIPRSSYR
ncbi:hypothetical protein HYPDE_41798 [Hyphomicrobium denitrificans 1NES1]|uniref:Uncharacterized protein n=1 Tax=Hyphomicrobium denitrificans 1NES1 TaxID=670307 RepID=N0BHY1_9HYPH|nr:hypothetical protein HYPDE_41798 [Hyphomicrobium denitrificans 1NES1]